MLLHSLPTLAAVNRPLRAALRLRDHVDGPRSVAVTFDDGPDLRGTPAVLEKLAAAGVQATFFLVGEQVARAPGLAAELAAAGHRVELHCHRHRSPLRLTPRQLRDDLRRGAAAISEATGYVPRAYRPPYGHFSAAAIVLARREGLEPVLWSRHGRDWSSRTTTQQIAERLTEGLRAGEVLLLHDGDSYGTKGSWRRTAEALPLVFDALDERGLRAVIL